MIVIFDSGDLDNNGNWIGEPMHCFVCGATTGMRLRTPDIPECGECGVRFEARDLEAA